MIAPDVTVPPSGELSSGTALTPLWSLDGAPGLHAEIITAGALPATARTLLDHSGTMTAALSAHFETRLGVTVLGERDAPGFYARKVVLHTQPAGRPVQLALIRIPMDAFPADAQAQIREGRVPFGALLREIGRAFTSRLRSLLAVTPDETMAQALGLTALPPVLYARHNMLVAQDGPLLAETIEVLPPL